MGCWMGLMKLKLKSFWRFYLIYTSSSNLKFLHLFYWPCTFFNIFFKHNQLWIWSRNFDISPHVNGFELFQQFEKRLP